MTAKTKKPVKEFRVYELNTLTGLRTPARKPRQKARSPREAVARVLYARYRFHSLASLAKEGIYLFAEEVEEKAPVTPPVQGEFEF
jgi:hypothetical protein